MREMNRVYAAIDYVYKCAKARIDLKPSFTGLAEELARIRYPHVVEGPAEMDECNRIMYAVLSTVYDGDIDCMVKMANYLDNKGKEWQKYRHSEHYVTNYEEYIFS